MKDLQNIILSELRRSFCDLGPFVTYKVMTEGRIF